MTATFDDYLWFDQVFPDLSEAYCITLVEGVTPAELLDRFGVVGDRVDRIGVGELAEPSYAAWETHDGTFSSSRQRRWAIEPWPWSTTAISV